MRLPRWTAVSVASVTSTMALSVSALATPAAASPAPDYELPFPCGQQWTGTTRSTHRPSPLSVDFNRPDDLGDLAVSAAPGVVSQVGDAGDTSYGKWVRVDHGDGHQSLYAHLLATWVTVGQPVDQGAGLGLVGDTGGVTGAHLHFEERLAGTVQQSYFHGTSYVFGTTVASQNCPDVPLTGDWDGDGSDEVAVFRRTGRGIFELSSPDGTVQTISHGLGSDAPLAGDWDGDGRTDVGVRRQRSRAFLMRLADGTTNRVPLGMRADVPVTGDWDGDSTTDIGVWRPVTARFRLLQADGTPRVVQLGSVGSQPLTGDWDGDGRTDLGVFDASTVTFTLRTESGDGTVAVRSVAFGAATDLPVAGDWNGDGITDVGTWSPSTAMFSLRTAPASGRATAIVTSFPFGRAR